MSAKFTVVVAVRMKRFLSLTLLLIALTPATAFADRIYLIPNDGYGDNFGFAGYMNGHPLFLDGGTDYFFSGWRPYAPGETMSGGALWLYSTVIWIDGVPTEFYFPGAGAIFVSPGITMPTDGRDGFQAFADVSFFHTGITWDGQTEIDVGGSAFGSFTFFRGYDGRYYPAGAFDQAPEPGTLGLIGTGSIGIVAVARKRLRTRQLFRGR